jgi:hypothetical protein
MSTRLHGVLDYLLGLFLLASPWIFGIPGDSFAWATAIAGGGGILLISVFTDYELSVARVIPMNAHLVLDLLMGLTLIVCYCLTYSSEVKWPIVAAGAMELVIVVATGFKHDEVADAHHTGYLDPAHHHATVPVTTPRM